MSNLQRAPAPAEVIALNMGPVVLAEVEEIAARIRPTVCASYTSSGHYRGDEGRISRADLQRLLELARRGATAVAS